MAFSCPAIPPVPGAGISDRRWQQSDATLGVCAHRRGVQNASGCVDTSLRSGPTLIEVLVGLYLLVGLFLRAALVCTSILLATFVCALILQILRGHTGDCGCVLGLNNPLVTAFVGGNNIGWWDVLRDIILLAMSLGAFFAPQPPILSVDALLAARREELDEDEILEQYEGVPGSV